MKKIVLVLIVALTVLSCKPENKAVAKVAGKKITQQEFDLELERLKKIAVPADYEMTEEETKMLKSQVLNSMIQKRMFEKRLNKLEIEADEAQVNQMMEQLKSQYGTEEAMLKDLSEKGFTLEDLNEEFEYRARLNALSKHIDELEANYTDKEIEEYYNENLDQFTNPGTITARHILINTDKGEEEALKKITEVKAEIEGGLDFADAAKKYSQGPSGENGGELRPFKKGDMVEEFYLSASTTEINTVSEPVLTQFGYHIILVEDRTEDTVAPIEETKEFIKSQLKQNNFLEDVEKAARIKKPNWAKTEK